MPTILGLKVDNLNWNEASAKVAGFFHNGRQHLIVSLNPEMVVAAQKDAEFFQTLNNSSLTIADGTGLWFAALYGGWRLKQRIPGVDFVWQLAETAERLGKSIFLLGGQNGVAAVAAGVLQNQFPNLKIYSGGDNLKADDPSLINLVNTAKPDILLVAFGHGRQEKWITRHLNKLLSVRVAMGVGGSFDFISGQVKRAPKIFQVLGLEWLWRLIIQPWRVGRIFTATFKFVWLVLRYRQYKIKD